MKGVAYACMFFMLLYLYLLPSAPWVENWFLSRSSMDNSLAREAVTHAWNIPVLFQYLLNATVLVIVPITFALTWSRGLRILPLMLVFTSLFISKINLSTSNFTFVLIQLGVLIAYLYRLKYLSLALVLALGMYALGFAKMAHYPSASTIRVVSDHIPSGSVMERTSYYYYRLILVPIEVNDFWYKYFEHREKVGFFPVEKPAVTIGAQVYHRLWPTKYLKTCHAYASYDADAYARFGWPGVGVAFVMVLALAWWIAYLPDLLWVMAVVHLYIMLQVSSLQAILFAQGFVIYLIIPIWRRYVPVMRR